NVEMKSYLEATNQVSKEIESDLDHTAKHWTNTIKNSQYIQSKLYEKYLNIMKSCEESTNQIKQIMETELESYLQNAEKNLQKLEEQLKEVKKLTIKLQSTVQSEKDPTCFEL